MPLLHKMSEFGATKEDMKDIYIKFIQSVLEFSCVVWGSSLTKENSDSLERIQKTACKLIWKEGYKTYKNSLAVLKIPTLVQRRRLLALSFAKSSLKTETGQEMFPQKMQCGSDLRQTDKFVVPKCYTNCFQKSSIPYMVNLLNEDW